MIMAHNNEGMNNRELDRLVCQVGSSVKGQPGFWEFTAFGRRLCCVTDESHNRMRVMTPIVDTADVSAETLHKCLEANFDRALDARYCVSDDTVWGIFVHPLRSLDEELFFSACRQVAELAKNFGTTYSSGELRFGGDP